MAQSAITPFVVQNYRCERWLGAGGMGEVFLAVHLPTGARYVVKELANDLLAQAELAAALLKAIKAARILDHPNIVAIHEIVKERNRLFVITDYVEGVSLNDVFEKISKTEPFSISGAIHLARQICQGLQYSHRLDQLGIGDPLVHGSLWPENVLLNRRADVFLSDFGSYVVHPEKARGRNTSLRQRYSYCAPEYLAGHKITKATDVFSVGVLFYQMMSGRALFLGDTVIDTVKKVEQTKVKPLANVPDLVNRVLLRCLAQDPSNRYEDAGELLSELVELFPNMSFRDARAELTALLDSFGPLIPKKDSVDNRETLDRDIQTKTFSSEKIEALRDLSQRRTTSIQQENQKSSDGSSSGTTNRLRKFGQPVHPGDRGLFSIDTEEEEESTCVDTLPGHLSIGHLGSSTNEEEEEMTEISVPSHLASKIEESTQEEWNTEPTVLDSQEDDTEKQRVLKTSPSFPFKTGDGDININSHGQQIVRIPLPDGDLEDGSVKPDDSEEVWSPLLADLVGAADRKFSNSNEEKLSKDVLAKQVKDKDIFDLYIKKKTGFFERIKQRFSLAHLVLVVAVLIAAISAFLVIKGLTKKSTSIVVNKESIFDAAIVLPSANLDINPKAQSKPPIAKTDQPEGLPIGEVKVLSSPIGTVFIDGKNIGQSPTTDEVKPGKEVLVIVVASGWEIHRQKITVPQNAGIVIQAKLKKAEYPRYAGRFRGTLTIRCENKDQRRVFLNGQDTGFSCPSVNYWVRPGKYLIGLYDSLLDKVTVQQKVRVKKKMRTIYWVKKKKVRLYR